MDTRVSIIVTLPLIHSFWIFL